VAILRVKQELFFLQKIRFSFIILSCINYYNYWQDFREAALAATVD